jgi:hypothetical protein
MSKLFSDADSNVSIVIVVSKRTFVALGGGPKVMDFPSNNTTSFEGVEKADSVN